MNACGICQNLAVQLFETSQEGVLACIKCQPLMPEVTIDDNSMTEVTIEDGTTLEVTIEETSDQSQPQSSSEQEGEAQYSCKVCNKTFHKNMQLQSHMRNHRAERRFVCTYCNKAFSQSNNLRAHLRIHTNERPFKCAECGKAFTQVTNLNNHVRLHTGERPFVCQVPGCHKAYAQVTNLNQHRKRHLAGRSLADIHYDCSICGARFDQRNHMYNHRREEHGEKMPVRGGGGGAGGAQARCNNCDLTFADHKALREHAAAHARQVADHDAQQTEKEGGYPCVFRSCGLRFPSPREHTEHLLAAHQLRVLTTRPAQPQRRGRPPKVHQTITDEDPLEIKESDYSKVKVLKQSAYLPKLKIQSLFHVPRASMDGDS